MDLATLKLFCDLIETRSFTRAAERNFVSQSAVSQKLHSLEKNYGQVLIDRGRGRGGVTTTDAGRILYEGALSLLSDASDLEARIRGLKDEVAGTVRVATVYSVGLHALPGRLKPFLAAHPQVNVHLEYSRTDKVYQDVLSGTVDVGIVACPAERPGIEIVPFGEEEMVVISATEKYLLPAEGLRLSDLQGMPFIAFADDIPTRKLTDQHLWQAGVRVQIVAAFDNIETIKNLVEIGSGVAIVPEDTVRQEVKEGTLGVFRLIRGDTFKRPAGILLKRARSRRAVAVAFVDAVRSV